MANLEGVRELHNAKITLDPDKRSFKLIECSRRMKKVWHFAYVAEKGEPKQLGQEKVEELVRQILEAQVCIALLQLELSCQQVSRDHAYFA